MEMNFYLSVSTAAMAFSIFECDLRWQTSGVALTLHIATLDPDNSLYDALDLNRGIKETFFSPSTPLSFLDRFTRKDGMSNLVEVLSKWNKGEFCICINDPFTPPFH